MPSMPGMSSGADVSLTIESDPPGADAKTSIGASCRTPCMVPVAADREFTVSYSLNGYLPQVIAVRRACRSRSSSRSRPAARCPAADLTPNPVFAQLQPPRRRRRRAARAAGGRRQVAKKQ